MTTLSISFDRNTADILVSVSWSRNTACLVSVQRLTFSICYLRRRFSLWNRMMSLCHNQWNHCWTLAFISIQRGYIYANRSMQTWLKCMCFQISLVVFCTILTGAYDNVTTSFALPSCANLLTKTTSLLTGVIKLYSLIHPIHNSI